MRRRILIVLSTVIFISPAYAADEDKAERKPPAHAGEWTDHNSSDPGVSSTVDELASIVVLCAKDHQSAEFKRAWASYLQKHRPGKAETAKLIQQVLTRAENYRQEFGQTRGNKDRSANWKGEASKTMHDTAKAIISNLKA